MEFNFNNKNDNDIKRTIGRNFSTKHEKSISKDINEEKTEQKSQEKKITPEPKKKQPTQKPYKENSTIKEDVATFLKNINVIPFLIFIICSFFIISQKDNLIPPPTTYNSHNNSQQEATIINEKATKQLHESPVKATEEIKTNEEKTSQENLKVVPSKKETQTIKDDSAILRPELMERANTRPQQTTPKVVAQNQPKISREEQLKIAEAYKDQIVNIIRQNWQPSTEEPEGGDSVVIFEITLGKSVMDRKLIKGVRTATINNRAYEAIYSSFAQLPAYPTKLGSMVLKFNITFDINSISSSNITLANK